ncbi:hypothetical protein AB0N31_06970 [Streptomyces sp. NPDC051051]|uniref:hypothetical protein n=1 Tax=Streptomyces sp. NPDC051051 TaxID=3155666 RepID=UPI00343036A4
MRRSRVGAVLVLCALSSACAAAGDSGGGSTDGLLKPTAQPGATTRAGGPGSAALVAGDADGFTVSTAADRHKVRVTENACAPLAQALSGTPVGKPVSTVVREASGGGATVTVVLAEYASDQAQTAMDAVGTALDECAAGFTATVDGVEHRLGKVAPELAPEGTDQAMGLGATVERAGGKTPAKAVILRSGDTVAYLSGTPSIPAALLDAQLVKLR